MKALHVTTHNNKTRREYILLDHSMYVLCFKNGIGEFAYEIYKTPDDYSVPVFSPDVENWSDCIKQWRREG